MIVTRSAAAVAREMEDGTVSVNEIGIASEIGIVTATRASEIETAKGTATGIATEIAC